MTRFLQARLLGTLTGVLMLSACAGALPYDPDFRGIFGGPLSTAPGAGGAAQVTDGFAGQGVNAPRVPDVTASATPTPAGTAPSTVTTPARTHTVAAGETAYSIARKYGVTLQQLAQANGLSESMMLRSGQVLTIPAATQMASTGVTAPGVGSPTPVPPSASAPLPRENPPAASTPVKTPANDLGSTRTASSNARLQMPASGGIVRAYQKGVNDGIDIAAGAGSTVQAAGAGTVAAITKDTDQVPIIVIRHSDGLMTVYANVDGVSVRKGASVSKGQSIAKARSGPVHFEVRQGFESVDPMKYL